VNGTASIIGEGTVFIETKPSKVSMITRLYPVFLLPGMLLFCPGIRIQLTVAPVL